MDRGGEWSCSIGVEEPGEWSLAPSSFCPLLWDWFWLRGEGPGQHPMALSSLSCLQLLPQPCPSSGAFYSWISQFAGFLGKPLYLRDNSSVCPTGLAFPDKLQLFRDGIILSCPERFQVTIGLVRKPGAICPSKVRTVLPTAWEHTLGCLPLSHYFWYQHFWQLMVLLEHTVFVPVDQWAGLAV